jgi:hypothetical protein
VNAFYTVVHSGNNVVNIIDLRKNAIINRVRIQGTLINGPIVVGDRCSVVYQDGSKRVGLVIKLPSGSIIDRFQA